MQLRILLFVTSAIAFASCNTAYKSGQTPDDVYYSPVRLIVSEDKDEKEEEKKENRQNETARYESYEEREIRMRIRDRRWRDLNNDYACNCSCDYTPYKYGYGYGYYYNPYYYPAPVYLIASNYSNPKLAPVRAGNLGGYNPELTVKTINPKTGNTEYKRKVGGSFNNSNTAPREVYVPSNNRTYSPSNSNSSNNNSSSNSNQSSGSGRTVPRSPRN